MNPAPLQIPLLLGMCYGFFSGGIFIIGQSSIYVNIAKSLLTLLSGFGFVLDIFATILDSIGIGELIHNHETYNNDFVTGGSFVAGMLILGVNAAILMPIPICDKQDVLFLLAMECLFAGILCTIGGEYVANNLVNNN